jgi:hypothetical protein
MSLHINPFTLTIMRVGQFKIEAKRFFRGRRGATGVNDTLESSGDRTKPIGASFWMN